MTLISYRAAAKAAQRSVAAIQNAVKGGTLRIHEIGGKKGFDPDEVRQWALRRWKHHEIWTEVCRINALWNITLVSMAVDIMQEKPDSVSFDGQVKRIKKHIYDFVKSCPKRSLNPYAYSEGHYFAVEETTERAIQLSEPNFHEAMKDDFELRYLYSLYQFVYCQLSLFTGEMEKRGLLKEPPMSSWTMHPRSLCLSTFGQFYDEVNRSWISKALGR